ncbi:MAG: hypothetical protein HON90_10485 [Halobacteriovoraceae bacterium]|jgi:hypothetical protein|nr:hypothetical protein [Halobacteriovoraceae bacterium]
MAIICYHCKEEIKLENTASISRSEECEQCAANIRNCFMCNFYDKNSYNECREPTADRIVDKEKANFCDFYKVNQRGKYNSEKEIALNAAEALFKN